MLGLLSHDPHFCLLREEVTFGRKAKKNTGLANANFYLLHLSLMREYLDLEFSSLSAALPFEYNLERIIDDFILMAIFVGNDFLPHLPDLHINEGALERIWSIYKEILPIAGGYLNEHGTIALPRLQLLLDKLGDFEIEHFEAEFADQNWFKGKQQKEIEAMEKARKRNKLVMTTDQQKLFGKVKTFVEEKQDRLALVNTLNARDRRFLQELADELHLRLVWDETDDYGQPLAVLTLDTEPEEDDEDGWEDENESELAIGRVLQKYAKAKVVPNIEEDFESSYEETLRKKMDEWKQGYYKVGPLGNELISPNSNSTIPTSHHSAN
jgi:5'-3' exoribonuclease 1